MSGHGEPGKRANPEWALTGSPRHENSTALPIFTTPAQIRTISNGQWEEWIENDSLPWRDFSAERHCQHTLRTILKSTRRRLEAA